MLSASDTDSCLVHFLFSSKQRHTISGPDIVCVKLVVILNKKKIAFQARWIVYLFHQALVAVKIEKALMP